MRRQGEKRLDALDVVDHFVESLRNRSEGRLGVRIPTSYSATQPRPVRPAGLRACLPGWVAPLLLVDAQPSRLVKPGFAPTGLAFCFSSHASNTSTAFVLCAAFFSFFGIGETVDSPIT